MPTHFPSECLGGGEPLLATGVPRSQEHAPPLDPTANPGRVTPRGYPRSAMGARVMECGPVLSGARM